MKQIKEKHSILMRWTHWINFPLLTIMIWSGMLIYWADDEYRITLFGHTYFRFFPQGFYDALHIPGRLAEGMAFHFLFMWFFCINGLLYVLYTLFSGEWRHLLPQKESFKEAWLVLLHDLHLRKTSPPQGKYNAAQRIAYTAIIIMGIGSVISGLAIYKPVQVNTLTWMLGGYHLARIIHFVLTIGYVFFFLIHIVQVALAGWNNFRSVISGFEIIDVPPKLKTELQDEKKKIKASLTVEQKIKRRNFISFGIFGAMGALSYKGWKWLYHAPEETPGITAGARKPLRKALNKTELFFRRLTFNENHLVKTYPVELAAKNVRHNEDIGAEGKFDINAWRMELIRANGDQVPISIDQIKALPKTEIVYDFKCVEGWDQIQHWGGLRFIDFIRHFDLNEEAQMEYVGLATPDKGYYVGLDMPSALHPQTILAYEINGKPLPLQHGAPLRLIIPVKYGIKNIKRIGTVTFSNTRPKDYWAEQGYDYFSGL